MQVSHVNTSALLLLRQANAAATGRPVDPTGVDPRTGQPYNQPPRDWTKHPNNPAVRQAAAE